MASLLEALKAIDFEATDREPSDGPTVSLAPGHSRELRDHVDDLIREAFDEGYTRGLWEAAAIARAALKGAA
jgi:hypothetical protein